MFEKQEKNLIIISLAAFFTLSIFYLFWSAERPFQEKWWAVHFEKLKGNQLDFVLENHSGESNFSYQLWQGEEKKTEQNFECKEEKCLVEIENENYQGKILIQVFLGEEKKEIYRNF